MSVPKSTSKMAPSRVMQITREVIDSGGDWEGDDLSTTNFLDAANRARDIIGEWSKEKRAAAKDYIFGLRELRDDFAAHVEADPLLLYTPAHAMMYEYHKSLALTRYVRAPNRVSKTQGAICDAAWLQRGIHPYRQSPAWPVSVAVIMGSFSKAAHGTWIPKLKAGETGNVLSPLFPESGRWFYRWDSQKYILELSCPACAKAGTNGNCKHPKSRWMLFSTESDVLSVAGGQHGILLIDEQVPREFYVEGSTRLDTVPNSSCTVTETPLGGKGFWTHKDLTKVALAKQKDGRGIPLVTMHTCSRYDAKMTPKWKIDARLALMTKQEAEARIWGRPSAWHEAVIFDNTQVSDMIEKATEHPSPFHGNLKIWTPDPKRDEEERTEPAELGDGSNTNELLETVSQEADVRFYPSPIGDTTPELRIFEPPEPFGQYVIGADVAQGLTDKDPSCAQVGKLTRVGLDVHIEQVAVWHGWVNSLAYAPMLYKMGLHYNNAPVVIERRGTGDATVQQLKLLGCWLLFRDVTDPAQAKFGQAAAFGLDTNTKTKSIYVSCLQNFIWDRQKQIRRLLIHDLETLDELGSFGQELTQSGMSFRFRGSSGTPDDHVMALAMLCYATEAFGLYNVGMESAKLDAEREAARETPLTNYEKEFWKRIKKNDALRKRQEALNGRRH